jgi:hypothetical protein
MADRIVYPSAVDYVRLVNENAVDNALGRRTSFLLLPSLYQRAFAIVHETGEVPVTENILAPDESVSRERKARINIITSST